ncbi:MAG: hypothetical protein GY804_03090 [Alphaproteobacteria bacterium]|nr:hypothetical protein [Alphaproteobacteria bacterium]
MMTLKKLPKQLFLTDEHRHPEIEDIFCIANKLQKDSGIIFRHYEHAKRKEFSLIIKEFCTKKGIKLIIADSLSMAKELDADGIHLPEWMTKNKNSTTNELPTIMEWAQDNGKILTTAAHSFEALETAHRINADAALLSPIFTTQSHPNAKIIDEELLIIWSKNSPVPLYALGGITKINAAKISSANGYNMNNIVGIASSGALWD